MQSPRVPTAATGTLATTPAAMMAKPSLLEALVRGSPWPTSGRRGSAWAASAWRTCRGATFALAGGPVA
eukprot:15438798-Alexandrium_andersonii.AAC.1